jgi:hypothetical protein
MNNCKYCRSREATTKIDGSYNDFCHHCNERIVEVFLFDAVECFAILLGSKEIAEQNLLDYYLNHSHPDDLVFITEWYYQTRGVKWSDYSDMNFDDTYPTIRNIRLPKFSIFNDNKYELNCYRNGNMKNN